MPTNVGNPQNKQIGLLDVFGYPPDNIHPRTTLEMKKSLPVVKFFPSLPSFQKGSSLFTLAPAWIEYSQLLKDNGYTINGGKDNGIQLAFLADNFPTDTFTNEYGENFLQKFTDIASEGAASISQMFGAEKATDVIKNASTNLKASENVGAKAVGQTLGFAHDMGSSVAQQLSKISTGLAGGGDLVNTLMAGGRLDFPMVWKTSSYQPSYSMTVRLYNPYPQSDKATQKYIIGPIVAIMLLGVPRARNASSYTWPFFHRIECPGLFDLNPGFISNITVVKGGDQQQISFQQRLGIVDIRIDVGSLYSSMIAGKSINSERPTVSKYAKTMAGERKVTNRQQDNSSISESVGDNAIGSTTSRTDIEKLYELRSKGYNSPIPSFLDIDGYRIPKPASPKIQAEAEDLSLGGRVTSEESTTYFELKKLGG